MNKVVTLSNEVWKKFYTTIIGNKFKEGTIIKGKDLKGHILCKILSEDLVMRDFQYKMGMNEDVNQLARKGSCGAGLHFCLVNDIYNYFDYGTKLAVVSVPDEEAVYVDDGKFRTHRLEIKKIMPFGETATWEYLQENGADITILGSYAVIYAAACGCLEVVKYLQENGADITDENNLAVRCAAENGHLEVVKYLHEHGSDITAYGNDAVVSAVKNGHLEVVKYLHKHGADITDQNDDALYWAAENDQTEVMEYLQANMQ
ncbi:MAG: ankyrin repeat domain-containing protein [Lachnospiraceae bacterium]|nr:ankyrin repeat domain-containing protein [Lachnospiraceae bacterium]